MKPLNRFLFKLINLAFYGLGLAAGSQLTISFATWYLALSQSYFLGWSQIIQLFIRPTTEALLAHDAWMQAHQWIQHLMALSTGIMLAPLAIILIIAAFQGTLLLLTLIAHMIARSILQLSGSLSELTS